jgi:hypothetical protein
MASRVENRCSDFSLPVAVDCVFASSPQSGWAWLCFLFPLLEPDRQISRTRAGVAPAEVQRLFTAHFFNNYSIRIDKGASPIYDFDHPTANWRSWNGSAGWPKSGYRGTAVT